MRVRSIASILGGLAVLMCLPMAANAALIPVLDSVTGPTAGLFTWNYQGDVSFDQRLDPTATNGVTCPGPVGTLVQCNPTGTFFTVYDVLGLQTVNASPANWTSSEQLVGITPSSALPVDSPTIENITWTYTGPVVDGPISITGFSFTSTDGLQQTGVFTSQDTKNVGAQSGDTDQVIGAVGVPAAPSPVPEPSSLLLVGTGIMGLIGMTRQRFRR